MSALRTVAPLSFLALPLAAQDMQTMRVTVSAREIHAVFPPAVIAEWQQPADTSSELFRASYGWEIRVDGLDGARWLDVSVESEFWPRRPASVEWLHRSARTTLCASGGMIRQCEGGMVQSFASGDTMHIVVYDSTTIHRLFGLRPDSVAWDASSPRREINGWARVTYVDPQIPPPTAELRAQVARDAWQRAASHHSLSRVVAGRNGTTMSWIAVGDSMAIGPAEKRCAVDTCGLFELSNDGVRWSVDDATIAVVRVHPNAPPAERSEAGEGVLTQLFGLRPGTTTVRARDLPPLRDAFPLLTPVPDTGRAVVHVHFRIDSVVGRPRTARVRVGDGLAIGADAYDATGRVVAGYPIQVQTSDAPNYRYGVGTFRSHAFRTPGHVIVVLSAANRRDTLRVTVVPRR